MESPRHAPDARAWRDRVTRRAFWCGAALLACAAYVGVATGPGTWTPDAVWRLLADRDATDLDQQAVLLLRLPRVLAGAFAGAAFALAGAVLQSMTRNVLAAPALVGIQPGAMLAVVVGLTLAETLPQYQLALLSFGGAVLGVAATFAVAAVMGRAARGIGLLLAGMAVGLTVTAIVQWLVLSHSLGRDLLIWQTGALLHADWASVLVMLPVWVAGFGLAAAITPALRVLAVGDDVATGLGARPRLIRGLGLVVVLLLAGATVSVAGGIAFVGLLVPHVLRGFVGPDERRLYPLVATWGAAVLVLADTGARWLRPPRETPVGVLLLLAGAAFFLVQIRRGRAVRMSLGGGS